MRTKILIGKSLVVGMFLAVCLGAASRLQAAGAGKFYLGSDIGLSLQQDLTFKEASISGLGTANLSDVANFANTGIAWLRTVEEPGLILNVNLPVVNNEATFDPGVRFVLRGGYNINEHFAVELESGFIWNSVDKLFGFAAGKTYGVGASYDTTGQQVHNAGQTIIDGINGLDLPGGLGSELESAITSFLGDIPNDSTPVNLQGTLAGKYAGADLYQIPIMVNGIYKFCPHGKFRPYLGAGVGVVLSIFDVGAISASADGQYTVSPIEGESYGDSGSVSGQLWKGGSDMDVVFGYQTMAGFNYDLTDRLAVGLNYKFLGTTDHDWNIGGLGLKAEGTFNHSILASINYKL